MIDENDKPVWFDFIEYDKELNQYLSPDTPEDVRKAYEEHLQEVENMSRRGEQIYKQR